VDIPDEYIPRVVTALEHLSAYMKATGLDGQLCQEVLDFIKWKRSRKEAPAATS